MPKQHDTRNRRIVLKESQWAELYEKHLDRLTPDVEMLEYIDAHQRPLYLPAPSESTPQPPNIFDPVDPVDLDYDSYAHHD